MEDEFIIRLKQYVECRLVCPEMEIDLGVPRPKIIIIKQNNKKILYQPETGRDLTQSIKEFVNDFTKRTGKVDGFVLKSKSPSCGITSANYYQDNKIMGRTDGFFAEGIKENFPGLPLEHEGRLKNVELREHFLNRIFSYAEFRRMKKELDTGTLVKFHTRYKYLLMTYSQKNLKIMGRIVADGTIGIKEKLEIYENLFYNSFVKRPSRAKHYNTILHIFGYFSKNLKLNEKNHFLLLLEKYKKGTIELKLIMEMLKNFAYRFEDDYLLAQKYINPFPEALY